MRRIAFLKLCLFTGLAGAAGIVPDAADELAADLHEALRETGLKKVSSDFSGGVLRVRCQVTDYGALSRKAGAMGDGQVKVANNTLSFIRKGQSMELQLVA